MGEQQTILGYDRILAP